jgi:uncharacterized membrane protein YbhN (UPF0104 family)
VSRARTWLRRAGPLLLVPLLGYGALALVPDLREAVTGLTAVAPVLLVAAVALEAASLVAFSGMSVVGTGSALLLHLMLGTALLVSIPVHGGNPLYVTAAAIGAGLVGGAGTVVVSLTRGGARIRRVVRRIVSRLPRLDADRVDAVLVREADRLRALGADPARLAVACGWGVANWLLDAGVLWVVLAGAGFVADPLELFVAYALAGVLGVLPLTPGGIGIVEGVLVPSLIGFGAPPEVALVGVLGWRLVSFWLPIPVGALSWLSLRVSRLRTAGGPARSR